MRIEQLTCPEHGMHDHRQLACNRHGRSLRAEPFLQFQTPGSQCACLRRSGKDDGRSLVKQPPQLIVTAARDMAIVVDFARLVASGGQANPCTDRARVPEVGRIFHRRGEGGGRNSTDAWLRGEQAAAMILARRCDQLLAQLC